jgi:hypothetical protein
VQLQGNCQAAQRAEPPRTTPSRLGWAKQPSTSRRTSQELHINSPAVQLGGRPLSRNGWTATVPAQNPMVDPVARAPARLKIGPLRTAVHRLEARESRTIRVPC